MQSVGTILKAGIVAVRFDLAGNVLRFIARGDQNTPYSSSF